MATPLLKWYLDQGLIVTKVYQVVEYSRKKCFKPFVRSVSTARREADLDPSKKIIADTMKLLGNSAYGSLILDKEKHQNVSYVRGSHAAKLRINQSEFRHLTELGDDYFEVETRKKTHNLNIPIHLGYYILQYGKMRLNQYVFSWLYKFLQRGVVSINLHRH